jgi:hypothetical protein
MRKKLVRNINMLKIKMLETRTGSPDGRTVCSYAKDEHYEIPDTLAKVFVEQGWAKPVLEKGRKPRKKDAGAVPENKNQ